MAATAWSAYDKTLQAIGQKVIDLDSDEYAIVLFDDTSNVGNNAMNPATYAAATGELATANGYTAGGADVNPATWTDTHVANGLQKWDTPDASWTPSGPGINARFAALRNKTTGHLMCWSQLCAAPDFINVAGINIDINGVFSMYRAG